MPKDKIKKNMEVMDMNIPLETSGRPLFNATKKPYDFSKFSEPTKLFKVQEFTSHAGKQLPFKIECDAFDEEDWDSIAQMILCYEKEPFCHAEGIPRGGLP